MPYLIRVFLLSLPLAAFGCSSEMPTAPVQGKVTMDDQPVYPARVTFTPVASDDTVNVGKASSAVTEVDGSYSIEAAGVGPNTVGVIMLPADEDSEEAEDDEMPAAVGKPEKPTYEVADGENVIDIKLKAAAVNQGAKASPGDDD